MPWKASSVMEERLRFVARLLDGEAMTDVCREFGISRKTGYKNFDRSREQGLAALSDRSDGVSGHGAAPSSGSASARAITKQRDRPKAVSPIRKCPLVHYQHRHAAVPQDLRCLTPQKYLPEAATPMRGHDDQVAASGLCCFDNRSGWVRIRNM